MILMNNKVSTNAILGQATMHYTVVTQTRNYANGLGILDCSLKKRVGDRWAP